MGQYILKRLGQTLIVLLVVSFLTFLIMYLVPGDPIYAILGQNVTPFQHDQLFVQLGLDKPFFARYFSWLAGMFRGDFGYSLLFMEPVGKLLSERLPITIYLDVIVLVISVPVGVLLGVTSATKRGKPLDNVITVFANIFSCVPIFWLGLLLIYLLSVKWHLLPTYGFTWPGQDLALSLKQSVMPVLVMTLTSLSPLARQARSSMLETINQDYIRTARSKGLKKRDVINKHALKNALIPVVTLLGIRIGFLLGGSPLVETVYSIPGMGSLLVKCLAVKDTPVIQACVLLTAAIICIVNLLVDILYGYIDPRIRVN